MSKRSDKKEQGIRNGRIKDLRTKQVLKQYPDGIKDKCPAFMVPNGTTNELMDLVFEGKVVGDVEIGEDGFLEIMFVVEGFGFFKLKRLPTDKQTFLMIV